LSGLLRKLFTLTVELFLSAAGADAKYTPCDVPYQLVLTRWPEGALCFPFRARTLSSHILPLFSVYLTDIA
jgi:hypothetical protein